MTTTFARRPLFIAFSLFLSSTIYTQVSITNTIPQAIDFNTSVAEVNNGPYAGTGFQPVPSAGQLDSDAWAVTGWSDGNLAFGGTRVTPATDYTRGTNTSPVTTSGFYALIAGAAPGRRYFIFQPGAADFAPGTLTLKVRNDSPRIMTQMSINYSLVVLNDQGRSTSLNLSHSTDDTTYLADTSANYTSTAAADTNPGYGLVFRNAIVTGLNVPPGGFFYLRWTTNDVGGSGSRDELGLGTINLTAGFTHTAQVVTKTADTNDGVCDADCSLREAVGVAFDDDTIVFSPLFTSPQTIVLSSGTEIATSRNVSVIGPGASLLTIDGGPGTNRIFSMSGIDSISGMTLTGGNGGGGNGGAVRSGAMLNITGVNFTGNSAANGGALDLSRGDVVNCSFSSNAASGAGGALYHDAMFGGDIRMINDTVVNNSASRGGGIAFENQNIGNSTSSTAQLWNLTVTSNLASSSGGGISLVDNSFSLPGVSGWLTSSIVAGNSAPAGPEIAVSGSAGFTSNGYNLLGDGPGDSASIGIFFQPTDLRDIDPGLGPLMLNGGETPTRDLLVSSPARDNGRADGLSADQRGSTRPVDNIFLAAATNGDNSDIGAVESSVLTVAIQGRVMSTSGRGVRNARVTLTYPNGSVITAVTGPRGFYRFDAALLAPSYNITVASRRFLFDPLSVSISDNLANCNITARS